MVDEVGYNARVRVQAGAALPGVSADSFGAGVGQAVAQAGAVIQQEQLENARLDRQLRDNAEWSAYLVSEAQAREELSTIARDGRLSDQPGHAARIAAELQKREEALLGSLSSERLRQQGRARVAEWGGSLRTREADYEFVRGQEIAIEAFAEQRGIAEGRVRRLDKPDDYKIELKLQVDAINALNTSDKVKQQLIDETEQRFGVAFIRGMTDRDPEAARALIDSGAFDGIITGDQVEVLRNGAQVEIDRLQRQRERERKAQIDAIDQQIDLFETREAAGLVTDPDEFASPIAMAKALGDQDRVVKLEVAQANAAFVRVWGPDNATTVQRSNRLAELNRKGDKRTDRDNLELNFLRKNSPGWASEEAGDPTGQAIRMGGKGAPPPLNIDDPASIAARARWAKVTGSPFMSNDEVATQLSPVWESGAQGKEQVLSVLNRLPPGQAMDAARRLDPDDTTLPIIVTLPTRYRNAARRGQAWLLDGANRKEWKAQMAGGGTEDIDPEIMARRREFEDALDLFPEDQKMAVRQTAEAMLAGYFALDGKEVTPERYEMALTMALGGEKRNGVWRGGLSRWNDRMFLLPSGISKEEFKRAAIGYSQGVTDYPANPDGSRANLFRAYPVAVGGGVYQFYTPRGEPIRTKSGKTFEVPIGAVE